MNPLIIWHLDDDPFEWERFARSLGEDPSYPVTLKSFGSISEVQSAWEEQKTSAQLPDIMVLDVSLGDGPTGIDMIQNLRRKKPEVSIFMRSSLDDSETISRALRQGADDYLSKNLKPALLAQSIDRAHTLALLKKGKSRTATTIRGPEVIGKTLQNLNLRVPQILNSAVTSIHIQGESGTGKEVVADLFQNHLPKDVPFVRVNCGAIPPSLLESEIFGHVRGSFTGATTDKKGLLEEAHGGWIFLDEIANLPAPAQASFLRALENHEILRVGGTKPIRVDFRVISATHELLPKWVEKGTFRKDLWQRLCETLIQLPPLRERKDEIEPLIHHFSKTMSGGPYEVSKPAMEILKAYPWSEGNIRELRNCLRAMTEYQVNKTLTPLGIPSRILDFIQTTDSIHPSPNPDASFRQESANTPHSFQLSLQLSEPISLKDASDALLVELTKSMATKYGRQSLRSLSKRLDVSPSTLSGRFGSILHDKRATFEQLNQWVSIKDDRGESP